MAISRIVQIAAAADGLDIAVTLRERLADQRFVSVGTGLGPLPMAHENAVLVFVLTPGALSDTALRRYAEHAAATVFPILPIVPTRDGFDYKLLTGELEFLRRLNAVGWDEGDAPGDRAMTAIRRYLGAEPFRRDCRLFISYRRSDGSDAARAIYRHFRGLGFDAFLDTEDDAIEPGEDVEARIHDAIPKQDFLLLIDSPDAADSTWVHDEVTAAMRNRVAIYVVRVGGSEGFPQVREMPTLDWYSDSRRTLLELERAVGSRLAARRSFDRRIKQTLEYLKPLVPCEATPEGSRRLLLTVGPEPGQRHILLDFEDAPYNLARLHRLSLGQREMPPDRPVERAVLVHRGRPLSQEEQEAVDWARGAEPLHVLALDQVVPFFLS